MRIVIGIFFVMLSGLLFAQQPDTLFRATANIYNYSASPFAGAEYRIFLSVNDLRGEPDISEIRATDIVVDGNCTFWEVKNVHVGGFGASGNIVLDVASLSGSQLPSVGFSGAVTRYGDNKLLGIVQEAPARVNTCITWYNTTVALGSPTVSIVATLGDTTTANPNPIQGDVIIKQDTAFVGWYTGNAWRVVYIQTTSGGGGAVSWNDLVDVPPGFADGVDDGILEVISDNTLLGAGIAGDPLKIDTTKAATRLWVQDQLDALPPSGVLSVLAAYGINVDDSDPANPIVGADTSELATPFDLSLLSSNLNGAIQDTAANIRADIPTNVSQLSNDSGYLTTEVDGSVTNEGALTAITVTPLESFSIRSNTAGSSDLTFFLGDNMSGIPLTPNSVTLFADDDQTAAEVPATPFSGVLANNVQGQLEEIQGNIPTVPTAVSAFTNDAGYLTSEADGDPTNELQTLSTTGAAGNITLSDGGGTLNLNVDDADASATNEGLLSVSAAGPNAAQINSNTDGSPSPVIKGGANSLISISGDTITIAATGGGGGGGGGTVESVTANAPATIDNTDPANPIVGVDTATPVTGLATRGYVDAGDDAVRGELADSIAALDIPNVSVGENQIAFGSGSGGLTSNPTFVRVGNNVGINKSNPIATLDVGGSIFATNQTVPSVGAGVRFSYFIPSALGQIVSADFAASQYRDLNIGAQNIRFSTQLSTNLSIERMRLSTGGFLGLGTTTPAYIFDINSTNAVKFPVGTTAQRPTGIRGLLRGNSTHGGFDLHDGTAWRRAAYYTDVTPADGQTLVYDAAEGAFAPSALSAIDLPSLPFPGVAATNTQDALEEVQGNIPTAVSQLTNDVGYITEAADGDGTTIINTAGELKSVGMKNPLGNAVGLGVLGNYTHPISSTGDPGVGQIFAGLNFGYTDSQNFGWQILGAANNEGNILFRTNIGGTLGSWRKMWNEINDGAASGLDADLLDGQQGSYYYSPANPPPAPAGDGNGIISALPASSVSITTDNSFSIASSTTSYITVIDSSKFLYVDNAGNLMRFADGLFSIAASEQPALVETGTGIGIWRKPPSVAGETEGLYMVKEGEASTSSYPMALVRTKKLAANVSFTSDEPTTLTELDLTLGAGTYKIEYLLTHQVAGLSSTIEPRFDFNTTGMEANSGSYVSAIGSDALAGASNWETIILPAYGDSKIRQTKFEGIITITTSGTVSLTVDSTTTPLDTFTFYKNSYVRWEKI